MNRHGQRFQASVDMVQFQGLDNPSGQISLGKGSFATVRALILNHTFKDDTDDNKKMFLSNNKKWNSSTWQGTYITQYATPAR